MRRLASVLAATALVLSGCSTIPTSGDVQSYPVAENERDPQARIEPDGPQEGADPSEIVLDFISAGAGSAENFQVARSFLTDSVTNAWNPLDGVTILPRSVDPAEIDTRITSDQQTVQLSVPVDGSVDANGVYRSASPGSETELEFTLRQQNGEWRISGAPDGIVLSASSFQNLYASYPLFFFDASYSYLVPENRWFLRRSAVATDIAAALLAGPSEWLSGAVVSAAPEGSRLDADGVVIANGVATVSMDDGGRTMAAEQYALLSSQLEASLEQVSTVSSVEVDVANEAVEASSPRSAQRIVQVDSRPVVVADGRLARLSGTRLESVADSPDMAEEDASLPTVSIDERYYAYLSDGRKSLTTFATEDSSGAVLLVGDNLVAPSIDISGFVWTAETDNEGRLEAAGLDGRHAQLSVPFLNDREIRSLEVSRDGTRLAVLSRTPEGDDVLEVIGINRGEEGLPTGVAPSALELGTAFDVIGDLSWSGPDSLVLLAAEDAGQEVSPWSLPVGGVPQRLGQVRDATTITAANDTASIRVGSSDGTISSRVGGSWQTIVDVRADDPSYPG